MLGIGMIFMIKRSILCLSLICSCSTLKIEDYKAILNEVLTPSEDIIVTEDLFNSKKYSFAKVRIGDDPPVLMTLATIDGDIFSWISSDYVKIRTKHGKIINTAGLGHDISYLSSSVFDASIKDQESLLLEVSNPHAIFSQDTDFSEVETKKIFLHKEYDASYVTETFKTDVFQWSGKNHYAFDSSTGLAIWSHQHIHPYLPSIELSFYYK